MGKKRLSMRKIREVLRLKYEFNRSNREIGLSCGIGRSTVGDYVKRATLAGFNWPLPVNLNDKDLESLLFPPSTPKHSQEYCPDFSVVHKELRSRKHVTLQLLWEEYKEANPEGYQYSWFCSSYREWASKLDLVMRQTHRAGEKLFVDYAGQTVDIIDPNNGVIHTAQIFVAVLGASNYTYAEATYSQKLGDWIGSHVRCLEHLGGVPEAIIPDNLRSGVSKSCRYEPDINPTYHDFSKHYNLTIFPARVRKPKDKAKAEGGVLLVERWILARLRNHKFFSLNDLNIEIKKLLATLNATPFQKMDGSRLTQFESVDKPALKPLPVMPYRIAHWKKATVNIDYHIEVDKHYYSVPHTLVKKKIEVRFTEKTVECYFKGTRVASHIRNYTHGYHTTVKEHMPMKHQKYSEWTPERIKRWAEKIGPQTGHLAELIMKKRAYPQQAFRSILGILRLSKSYGENRLENACSRALSLNTTSYRSIESILKNGLDQHVLAPKEEPSIPVEHHNIRGAQYYKSTIH